MRARFPFAAYAVHVPVKAAPYDIIVGRRMTSHLGPTLRSLGVGRDIAVITDRTVARLHLDPVLRHLLRQTFRPVPIVLPPGEHQKSIDVSSRIYSTMLRNGIGRDGAVMALGGGVIGDLAGFVAATYQRGVDLVHVPTTLLAQVDSSIGGKVAVNHPFGKNMIGAFYQPRIVWTDVSFLRTLPAREVVCGLGEIIKYGVIRDGALFGWLEHHAEEVLRKQDRALVHVQGTCSAIKAGICGRDEREAGERVILNYGHTVGHALESAGGYGRIKHGEAVLLGMKAEAWIAREIGMLSDGASERIFALIDRMPLTRSARGLSVSAIMQRIGRDKKNRSGRKRFVLPTRIGRVKVVEGIDDSLVRASLRAIL